MAVASTLLAQCDAFRRGYGSRLGGGSRGGNLGRLDTIVAVHALTLRHAWPSATRRTRGTASGADGSRL